MIILLPKGVCSESRDLYILGNKWYYIGNGAR